MTDEIFDQEAPEKETAPTPTAPAETTVSRIAAGDSFTHEGTGALVSAGDVLVATADNEHILTIPAQLAASFTVTKNGKTILAPGVTREIASVDGDIRTPGATVSVRAGESYLRSSDGHIVVLSEQFASATQ